MTRIIMLLALLATALPAAARIGWYAGIAGGESKTSRDLVANRESTITLASDIRTAFDDRDSAWKAYAGLELNRVIALEITYADLGSHHMLTTMQGGDPPAPASIAVRRKISGYGVDLVAMPPLDWNRINLFGRIGAFQARLEASAELDGNIVFTGGDPGERFRSTTQRSTVLKWGVGAQWWFLRNAAARLEWERYSSVGKPFAVGGSGTTGEADTDVWSAGVLWRF